ncbi:hypothetical protein BC829DRAFT_393024 [Chytridium lagenaria]|nr:hypothetical protein BC829DRAFT_393024 [Chytridium lagenaria]
MNLNGEEELVESDEDDEDTKMAEGNEEFTWHDLKSVTKFLKSKQLTDLMEAINHLKNIPRPASRNTGPVEEDPEYKILVNATNYSADVDSEILVVHRFLKEKYSPRFSELETLIPNALDYARTVKAIGNEMDLMNVDLRSLLPQATVMIVTVTATTTSGRQLTPEELNTVMEACDAALTLDNIKRTSLVVTSLSKIPACNFKSWKAGKSASGLVAAKGQEKHAGFIYYSDFVQNFPKDYRIKACRMIAAKERESSDGSTGRAMREDVRKKLEKMQEPPPGWKHFFHGILS